MLSITSRLCAQVVWKRKRKYMVQIEMNLPESLSGEVYGANTCLTVERKPSVSYSFVHLMILSWCYTEVHFFMKNCVEEMYFLFSSFAQLLFLEHKDVSSACVQSMVMFRWLIVIDWIIGWLLKCCFDRSFLIAWYHGRNSQGFHPFKYF